MSDINCKENDNTKETQRDRFLTFTISDVTYGIEMYFIREIVGLQEITEVPEMPDYIKGIINLRGIIIPVMDVRIRFGKDQRDYDDRTCVIVVEISGNSVGLIVDSVCEVLPILSEEISEAPDFGNGQTNRFIQNVGKSSSGIVLIINSAKLLNEKELETLGEIA